MVIKIISKVNASIISQLQLYRFFQPAALPAPRLRYCHPRQLSDRDGFFFVYAGKWKADSLHGPFFIINDRMRVLGTMVNNKLEGYNAISIQESLVSNKAEK